MVAARTSGAGRYYGPHWRLIRGWVLLRDFWCRICGHVPSVEVDHIVPRSGGGSDHQDNLQGTCRPCNRRKGATVPS